MQIRLDKYLADAGMGTRKGVRDLIRSGRIRIDGRQETDPGKKVDTDTAEVLLDETRISYSVYSYYVINKPAGILSASRDGREKTVVDLIPGPRPRDLFPVGRLDRDTVGLLLITNDGGLSHRLLAPGRHVPKVYLADYSGSLPEDAEERLLAGVDIGDPRPAAPAVLRRAGEGRAYITLTEGRFHEVKRLFTALGCEVTGLERISMGGYTLPKDMERGEVREISEEEVKLFLAPGPEAEDHTSGQETPGPEAEDCT